MLVLYKMQNQLLLTLTGYLSPAYGSTGGLGQIVGALYVDSVAAFTAMLLALRLALYASTCAGHLRGMCMNACL